VTWRAFTRHYLKEQKKLVREWANVSPEKRVERGVLPAAWKALEVFRQLAREAELRDFLMKLIGDYPKP
jgi:hypothetical protein